MIIIRKPCQRSGKRAVLRLDLNVDRVAVCLRLRETMAQRQGGHTVTLTVTVTLTQQ